MCSRSFKEYAVQSHSHDAADGTEVWTFQVSEHEIRIFLLAISFYHNNRLVSQYPRFEYGKFFWSSLEALKMA